MMQRNGIVRTNRLTIVHEQSRHGTNAVLVVDGNHRVRAQIQQYVLYTGSCHAPDPTDAASRSPQPRSSSRKAERD